MTNRQANFHQLTKNGEFGIAIIAKFWKEAGQKTMEIAK
jgi:hypothetical protein